MRMKNRRELMSQLEFSANRSSRGVGLQLFAATQART
jgi:hypothetical protein